MLFFQMPIKTAIKGKAIKIHPPRKTMNIPSPHTISDPIRTMVVMYRVIRIRVSITLTLFSHRMSCFVFML